MFGIGVQELIIILAIVLLLFGGKKLPELSRGLGNAIKEIRGGFKDSPNEDASTTASSPKNTKPE